jgi:hypothetical protein
MLIPKENGPFWKVQFAFRVCMCIGIIETFNVNVFHPEGTNPSLIYGNEEILAF